MEEGLVRVLVVLALRAEAGARRRRRRHGSRGIARDRVEHWNSVVEIIAWPRARHVNWGRVYY